MKRNYLGKAVLGTMLLGVLLLAGCGSDQSRSLDISQEADSAVVEEDTQAVTTEAGDKSEDVTAANVAVTEADAKKTALKDAQLKESEVEFTKVALETDDDVQKYEIEFVKDGVEYSYDIDAGSGDILSKEQDQADDQAVKGADVKVAEDKAIETALKDAGLTKKEVTGLKTNLDDEDGKAVYDIEFKVGQTEYSYEVDADSGKILKSESEEDND